MTGGQAIMPAVEAALTEVIDPELGLSVVDIGLIYSANMINEDHLLIRITTTTRG